MHRRHLHHYPRPMQHYLFPLLAAAALAGCGSQFPLRPDNGKTTTVSLHNTTPQAQYRSFEIG
jgi:predicted small lipoprotein YifL